MGQGQLRGSGAVDTGGNDTPTCRINAFDGFGSWPPAVRGRSSGRRSGVSRAVSARGPRAAARAGCVAGGVAVRPGGRSPAPVRGDAPPRVGKGAGGDERRCVGARGRGALSGIRVAPRVILPRHFREPFSGTVPRDRRAGNTGEPAGFRTGAAGGLGSAGQWSRDGHPGPGRPAAARGGAYLVAPGRVPGWAPGGRRRRGQDRPRPVPVTDDRRGWWHRSPCRVALCAEWPSPDGQERNGASLRCRRTTSVPSGVGTLGHV